MEITWYGLGCFRLSERGCPTIVTDPFEESLTGLHLPRTAVNVVTWSRLMEDPQEARWPDLRGEGIHTVAGPGEYEIGGVFITGIASNGPDGADAVAQNVIFAINCQGVVVCHLGALGRTPTQAQIEPIGRVNVLLVPVGLNDGLTMTMASETVSLIEPDIVIPMQYETPGLLVDRGPVDQFLKEMGVTHPTVLPTLKVTAGVATEETQVVLLEPYV
jgi:L-ascorbate metabolism protein UlaG (beta-lactamase superfamily)